MFLGSVELVILLRILVRNPGIAAWIETLNILLRKESIGQDADRSAENRAKRITSIPIHARIGWLLSVYCELGGVSKIRIRPDE